VRVGAYRQTPFKGLVAEIRAFQRPGGLRDCAIGCGFMHSGSLPLDIPVGVGIRKWLREEWRSRDL
jgi:hypothetical protein